MNKDELLILHSGLGQLEVLFQFKDDAEGQEACSLISEKIEVIVQNWPAK